MTLAALDMSLLIAGLTRTMFWLICAYMAHNTRWPTGISKAGQVVAAAFLLNAIVSFALSFVRADVDSPLWAHEVLLFISCIVPSLLFAGLFALRRYFR